MAERCPRSSRDSATVLIIDPDPSSRELYGTLLRHQGHQVIEAGNGAEGILLARERRPDVVVTETLRRRRRRLEDSRAAARRLQDRDRGPTNEERRITVSA